MVVVDSVYRRLSSESQFLRSGCIEEIIFFFFLKLSRNDFASRWALVTEKGFLIGECLERQL